MKLEIDSTAKPDELRAAAAFCLMLAGDIAVPALNDAAMDVSSATGAALDAKFGNVVPIRAAGPIPGTGFPSAPPVPSNTAPAVVSPVAATVVTAGAAAIPPNAHHAFGFPPIPAPQFTSAQTAVSPNPMLPFPAPIAAPLAVSSPATAAAGAQTAASVEYDSAGLPWDGRIHNKGRTKKKDGTWKLQKGLDPIVAQSVVAELAAKRVSVPQAPIPVPTQPAAVPSHEHSPLLPMQHQPASAPFGSTQGGTVGYPQPLGQGPLMPDMSNSQFTGHGAPSHVSAEARAAWAGTPPPPREADPRFGSNPDYVPPAPIHGVAPPEPSLHALNNPQVPLPPFGSYPGPLNTSPMPVPPVTIVASAPGMPTQPIATFVPPAPQPSSVGSGSPPAPASGYKQLIDKLTAATQNRTLNPALVSPTVQRFGVPNMGMLSDPQYAAMLPVISQEFDRLIAGGAPSGP